MLLAVAHSRTYIITPILNHMVLTLYSSIGQVEPILGIFLYLLFKPFQLLFFQSDHGIFSLCETEENPFCVT